MKKFLRGIGDGHVCLHRSLINNTCLPRSKGVSPTLAPLPRWSLPLLVEGSRTNISTSAYSIRFPSIRFPSVWSSQLGAPSAQSWKNRTRPLHAHAHAHAFLQSLLPLFSPRNLLFESLILHGEFTPAFYVVLSIPQCLFFRLNGMAVHFPTNYTRWVFVPTLPQWLRLLGFLAIASYCTVRPYLRWTRVGSISNQLQGLQMISTYPGRGQGVQY